MNWLRCKLWEHCYSVRDLLSIPPLAWAKVCNQEFSNSVLTYSMSARHLGPFVFGVIVPSDHVRGIAELHCIIQYFLRGDRRSAKKPKNEEHVGLILHAVVWQAFAYLQLFGGVNRTKLICWYAFFFRDQCKEFLDRCILPHKTKNLERGTNI